MLGAVIGDIVGSRFEWNNIKAKEFDLFTNHCFFAIIYVVQQMNRLLRISTLRRYSGFTALGGQILPVYPVHQQGGNP